MQWTRDDYLISDDPAKLDLDQIYQLLSNTYWAYKRTRQTVMASIANSIPLGLYHGGRQIGFARIVTDRATFAWLCDVVIDPDYRGRELGKWLVEVLVSHPTAQVSLQLLRTKDAHTLYEQNGFVRQECLTRRPNPDDAWETAAS